MTTYYVWSGSLKGFRIDADSPRSAVDAAVRENLPCLLSDAIRVSVRPKGLHPMDVYYEAPYEDQFPDLFDGSLDVQVGYMEPPE
jgi:hypothetical protein